MPDWSYQPVFRPLLFRLPAATARDLTLSLMGTLARTPGGPALIDFLGHMRPPECLRRTLLGITFPSPLGLGAGLDVRALALPALARFGFGFLELGPVTAEPWPASGGVERRTDQAALCYAEPWTNLGIRAWCRRLARPTPFPVPLGMRLGHAPGAGPGKAALERKLLIEQLAALVDFFTLDARREATDGSWSPADWAEHLRVVHQALREAAPSRPLLLGVPPDLDANAADRLVAPAWELGVRGVVVAGGIAVPTGGRLTGGPTREMSLALVRHLRRRWGNELVLLGSGGILEPQDALDLLDSGADLVQIHSGLVYTGPGFPKRINEALVQRALAAAPPPAPPAPLVRQGWFWIALLGVGMVVGGALALAVAATRVVLPYDESFVCMSRAQLQATNARLLHFMAHDRVTLAGTMIAVGVLYTGLGLFGMRRGMHWARQAALASAGVGFASFFLCLGFGYFDPLHALVTALLFPIFVLGALGRQVPPAAEAVPSLRNDRAWRRSLWGQLLLVVQGFGLTTAGLVIALVGVTGVFVKEDLEFLQTTAGTLRAINPRLLPLVAHDRAGFGGCLVSCGVAVLLTALWGYRRGRCWLWWTVLLAGASGYAAALAVHFAVGYTDPWHLAPAYAGGGLFLLGQGLSYPFLCPADEAQG